MSKWYYAKNGSKHGPVTGAELKTLAANGTLSPEDKVWREGLKEWKIASKVIGLFPTGKTEDTSSSPPPLPEVGNATTNKSGSTKPITDKSAPSASLDDATPFDELFNNTQQANFSQAPGPRQTSTSQGIERFNTLLSRFDANQFTWGYRIALAVGILGVFLPWYSASSVFNSSIAAGSSSASVSGILLLWGILALLAGGWGLLVSVLKPKWITQISCAISMALFTIIGVLQINAFSPVGVNVHSSYGGFSAFGSFASGVAVGAWLTLISGVVASVLCILERSKFARSKAPSPQPDVEPPVSSKPSNNNKQAAPTQNPNDLVVSQSYRLYKSDKTPMSRKLLGLAIICCLLVSSAILVNKLYPGLYEKGISTLTGTVTTDAFIDPFWLDKQGSYTVAEALFDAARKNPKATTIVVKLWLKSKNRDKPNLIHSHTFNAIDVETARKCESWAAFLHYESNEHGIRYETLLSNEIEKIRRGW